MLIERLTSRWNSGRWSDLSSRHGRNALSGQSRNLEADPLLCSHPEQRAIPPISPSAKAR